MAQFLKNLYCLVVSTPLKNMKVSWGYFSQYMEKKNVPNHQTDINSITRGLITIKSPLIWHYLAGSMLIYWRVYVLYTIIGDLYPAPRGHSDQACTSKPSTKQRDAFRTLVFWMLG